MKKAADSSAAFFMNIDALVFVHISREALHLDLA